MMMNRLMMQIALIILVATCRFGSESSPSPLTLLAMIHCLLIPTFIAFFRRLNPRFLVTVLHDEPNEMNGSLISICQKKSIQTPTINSAVLPKGKRDIV